MIVVVADASHYTMVCRLMEAHLTAVLEAEMPEEVAAELLVLVAVVVGTVLWVDLTREVGEGMSSDGPLMEVEVPEIVGLSSFAPLR